MTVNCLTCKLLWLWSSHCWYLRSAWCCAAVYRTERLRTEFNALNKEIGQRRKVQGPCLHVKVLCMCSLRLLVTQMWNTSTKLGPLHCIVLLQASCSLCFRSMRSTDAGCAPTQIRLGATRRPPTLGELMQARCARRPSRTRRTCRSAARRSSRTLRPRRWTQSGWSASATCRWPPSATLCTTRCLLALMRRALRCLLPMDNVHASLDCHRVC